MNRALQKQDENKKMTVKGLMQIATPEIQKALPKHMTPDRMARILMTEIHRVPKLQDADPHSFMGAAMQACQLGLEPGSHLGHVYMIPFFNGKRRCLEVQLMMGYRGMVELAYRSGKVSKIRAEFVRTNDVFDPMESPILFNRSFENGDEKKAGDETLLMPAPKKPIQWVFAEAQMKDGSYHSVVMDMQEVLKARDASKNSNNVWDKWFTEMAKKTAIRRLSKLLPMSPEMADASDLENLNELGVSQGNRRLVDKTYDVDFATETQSTPAELGEEHAAAGIAAEKQAVLDLVLVKIEKAKEAGVKQTLVTKVCGTADVKKLAEYDLDKLHTISEALEALS